MLLLPRKTNPDISKKKKNRKDRRSVYGGLHFTFFLAYLQSANFKKNEKKLIRKMLSLHFQVMNIQKGKSPTSASFT